MSTQPHARSWSKAARRGSSTWRSSCPRRSNRSVSAPRGTFLLFLPRRWAGMLVLLFAASWGCVAQERILLKVVVNTVDKGEYFLQKTDDGDVLFPAGTLRRSGSGIQEATQ